MALKQCFGDCGCQIINDPRGTTTVTGAGSSADPFQITATNMPYTRPAGRSTRSTTQSISQNTLTAVSMNTETFDTDNMIDIAGNPTRLTISTSGIYVITGGVQWARSTGLADGIVWHEISLRRNGSTVELVEGFGDFVISAQSIPIMMSISGMFNCIAGDYWELLCQYSSTQVLATLNLDPSAVPPTFSTSGSVIRLEAMRLGAAS